MMRLRLLMHPQHVRTQRRLRLRPRRPGVFDTDDAFEPVDAPDLSDALDSPQST